MLPALLSALFALVAALLPACVSVTPEAPGRLFTSQTPEPIPEYLWPPRLALEFPLASPAVGQTESELIDRPVTFWIPRDDWHAWLNTMSAGGAMKRLGVWGRGNLSEVIVPPGPDRYSNITWSRMFLFFTSAEYADLPYPSRVEMPKKGPAARPLESALTVMRYFEPHRPPKGLIVHLTGIRGVDQELYIASTLTSRGWAVLSIPPPSKALEKHNVKHWVGSGPLDRGTDLEQTADRLARLTDWALAEWAYAAEAAVSYLVRSRPDLDGKPRAIFASSMGALAAPAVAARMPGTYSAAVLVAGGGSLLRVIHESDATAEEFDLRWTDEARFTDEEWERLDALTQQRSRLDPLVAARFLGGIPVLQIHATMDAIVPSEAGDRLHKALGYPERWSYPLGHVGIFVIFPLQIETVSNWLESKVFPP